MLEIIRFEVNRWEGTRVIGIDIPRNKGNSDGVISEKWDKFYEDGTLKKLVDMQKYHVTPLTDNTTGNPSPPEYVGLQHNYNLETLDYVYTIGMLMKSGAPVPKGYAFCDLPVCKMASAWVRGSHNNGEIYNEGYELVLKKVRESGFADECGKFWLEAYSDERFTAAFYHSGGEDVVIDYHIPLHD
jgi:hypothetical protein